MSSTTTPIVVGFVSDGHIDIDLTRIAHLIPVRQEHCNLFPPSDMCAHCSKTAEQLGSALKKCTGCSRVVYCSRECQRSAWGTHKPLCHSKSSSYDLQSSAVQSLGYATLMELTTAHKDWACIHDYTFGILAQITVYLNGGIDYNFASPRAVVIRAEARVRTHVDMNPGGLFRLRGVEIVDKDERYYVSSKWVELQASCARRTEHILASRDDPKFAGVLPATIILYVVGIGTVSLRREFPIYRPRCHDITALDNPTRLALMDLTHVCEAGIAAGISFHPSKHPMRPPEVHEWVQTAKKNWKSVRVRDWNWNTNMGRIMSRHPAFHKSGLRPLALWSTFRNL